MGTYIVLAVLLIIIVAALRSSAKHLKGEGGCCGGGDAPAEKIKKQKLDHIEAVKRLRIDGMTCDHCRQTVENSLNALDQVNAKVNLGKQEAIVKLGEHISDAVLKQAVEQRGYQVVSIETVKGSD